MEYGISFIISFFSHTPIFQCFFTDICSFLDDGKPTDVLLHVILILAISPLSEPSTSSMFSASSSNPHFKNWRDKEIGMIDVLHVEKPYVNFIKSRNEFGLGDFEWPRC